MNQKWTIETTNQFLNDYAQFQQAVAQGNGYISQLVATLIQQIQAISRSNYSPDEKMIKFLEKQNNFCSELNKLWSTGHKHDDIEKYFEKFGNFLHTGPKNNTIIKSNYFNELKSKKVKKRRDYLNYFNADINSISNSILEESSPSSRLTKENIATLVSPMSQLPKPLVSQPIVLSSHQQGYEIFGKQPTVEKLTNLATKLETLTITPHVEKSWHFDAETKAIRPEPNKIYELLAATNKDKRKVIEFYQHHSVPGYDIASVQVIYNPDMNHKFNLYLKELQQRDNNPAFSAKWPTGRENSADTAESTEQIAWRSEIYQRYLALANPYQDNDYPAVRLLPMWHGTQLNIVDSIFRTGYANLATTDSGYFGKGIYGAYEAEYSYRVYAKHGGTLILNWMACFSAYPVINDGSIEKKFEGRGNYSNYDAHFIPVVPRNADNPDEEVYLATKPDDIPQYNELVVFQSNACLPRYLVELQPTLVKPPAPLLSTIGYSGTFFSLVQEEKKEEKPPTASQYHTPSMLNN